MIIAIVAGLLTWSWRYLIRRRRRGVIIGDHPPTRSAEQVGTGPLTAAPNRGEARPLTVTSSGRWAARPRSS